MQSSPLPVASSLLGPIAPFHTIPICTLKSPTHLWQPLLRLSLLFVFAYENLACISVLMSVVRQLHLIVFDLFTLIIRGSQTLGAKSPGQPDFKLSRLISVDPYCGTYFILSLWRLELWGGSYILEAFSTLVHDDGNEHKMWSPSLSSFLRPPGTSCLSGANKTADTTEFFAEENYKCMDITETALSVSMVRYFDICLS
jgi:hypothetical protein